MNRRSLYFALCCICLLFSSCIKKLEDEGIYGSTRCYGIVLDDRTFQPVQNVRLILTDGINVEQSVQTGPDGKFEISVSMNNLAKDYYLIFESDSLYESVEYYLDEVPMGGKEYEIGTIYMQGPDLPIVSTSNVIDITATSAHAFGRIESTGGSTIVEQGFVYSTMQYPTIDNEVVTVNNYSSSFDYVLPLRPHTTYYVRAFAKNGIGVGYGSPIEITTQDGLALVLTDTATAITATSATCGGEVVSDAGFYVSARGLCWSTTPNPTISNAHTNEGAGLGSFTSNLGNLESHTTYYIRAYAQNSAGIAYGGQVTFTTLSGLPEVTTTVATNVTATQAIAGGNVLSDGGFPVSSRGVCFGTSPQPTISGYHTTDGVGIGEFVSNLINLVPGTTYYYRAYATNGVGTVYGEQYVFVAW